MAAKEKPVSIEKGKGEHRVDTHIFARNIREAWCAQPGCRFRGQPAVQGHCHTTKSFAGDDFEYQEHLSKCVEGHVDYLKKRHAKLSGAARDKMLFAEIAVMLMNDWFATDELVRLRRDNARLRDDVKRLRKRLETKP